MQGFHPKFKDFPGFILGITHEIWEEKQVETLYHYYSDDISTSNICTQKYLLKLII